MEFLPDTQAETLVLTFQHQTGARPVVISRAPGRVNLLGEHIDYNGLPVLPMTIDRTITAVAGRATGNRVRIFNTDPSFVMEEFENGESIEPSPRGSWTNYCKAAIVGVNAHFGEQNYPGFDAVYSGTIPAAAGLSSSSALVVATALAYLRVIGHPIETERQRLDLAAMLAQAERYVGVQGGGMDQAIILLGDEQRACKIDFFPLRVERVPVFEGHAFIICNSLEHADKSGSAILRYNEGPSICRLIRAIVEKCARMTYDEEITIPQLGDLWYGPLCLCNDEVEALFDDAFPRERTTLAQAASMLDLTEAEIRRRWLGELPEPAGGFPLRARARHQLTEMMRVDQGRDCLLAGDAAAFGSLMNDSHESCATDYGVSTPRLDTLVAIGRNAGSLGSRLTGAGFGGCTVHLVPVAAATGFMGRVVTDFYRSHLNLHGNDPLRDDWIIPARAVSAANCRDL